MFAAASAILTGAALYRFRVHQLTRQLSVRFEERLAERTRIAQELHDTLLQGFLSASMQLHVVADQMPDESPSKLAVDQILALMCRVIDEGRNAVRGLRASENSVSELAREFSLILKELGSEAGCDLRVTVSGEPRPLQPILRDEVYRIGREALINAFRHAHANHIEIEFQYAAKRFRMLIRDDGCGIDPGVLRAGRDGHWGLVGMRERANSIGAEFHLRSSPATGTEVELTVPGSLAFPAPSRKGLLRGVTQRFVRR